MLVTAPPSGKRKLHVFIHLPMVTLVFKPTKQIFKLCVKKASCGEYQCFKTTQEITVTQLYMVLSGPKFTWGMTVQLWTCDLNLPTWTPPRIFKWPQNLFDVQLWNLVYPWNIASWTRTQNPTLASPQGGAMWCHGTGSWSNSAIHDQIGAKFHK